MLRPEHFLYETDPKKQTAAWADKVITRFRMDWRPVVDSQTYFQMKQMLLSANSLDYVKKLFKDEDFLKDTTWQPIPVWEKPKNIIIDQAKEAGIKPYIKSVDPSSKNKKDQDIFRLRTKRVQQSKINSMRGAIGVGVPLEMNDREFNGNLSEFDKMGMNPQDESDVAFFFDNFYKLNYEAYAQSAVWSYIKANNAEEDISRYLLDIMAMKHMTLQVFVSPATGEMKTTYLQPNEVYEIKGNRRDGTDAAVRGWQRQITIRELMDILGDKFNFERDWMQLILAINYGSNTTFTGFMKGGISYNMTDFLNPINPTPEGGAAPKDEPVNLLDYDNIYMTTYNYKVYFGFIEWPQATIHAEKRSKVSGQMFPVPGDYKPTEKSDYTKEEWGYFVTKQANYIATSPYSQRVYNYGDMYLMPTKGMWDEFATGSICIVREEGLSAAKISEPYVKIANIAFYKMLWAMKRSKPDVWSYAYESIVEVAKKMQQNITQGTNTPQGAGQFGDAVNKLIDQFDKKLMLLHTYPIVDGQAVGGGGLPHQKIPGQLDPIVLELQNVILNWAEMQIGDKIGLSGLAAAQAPNPRDGLKLNEIYLRQSRAATGYIPRLFNSAWKHCSNVMLNYIQDIMRFKDSLAYKYLVNLVGDDAIEALAKIGNDAAPHRFSIFATSYEYLDEKQNQLQEAQLAFSQKLISYPEYLLVKSIEIPEIAAKVSAYFQEKAIKRQEAQVAQAQQNALALDDRKTANLIKVDDAKSANRVKEIQAENDRFYYLADKQYQGKIESAGVAAENDKDKQQQKLENEKQLLHDKANEKLQQSFLAQ